MKKDKTYHSTFFTSPYLIALISLYSAAIIFGIIIAFSFVVDIAREVPLTEVLYSGEMFCFLLILSLYLLSICIFFFNAYEYFGRIEIKDDCLILKAPFRPRRVLYYSEIKDTGIDFGMISGTRQLWIYFSNQPLDKKYVHRINRLPFSPKCFRVQYRTKVYESLLHHISCERITKQLSRASSILRIYPVDE